MHFLWTISIAILAQIVHNKSTISALKGGEKMDGEKIGQILRGLRGEKSAVEVSSALGISKSALAMYERGDRIPRDEIKVRIAKYYKKSVQSIFFI